MTRHLGMEPGEVHAQARAVLDYWFGEVPAEKQFVADPHVDAEIGRRFGALRDAVFASRAEGWRDDPEALLAAVILLDQFSRNLHRGHAEAFAADGIARELALLAITRGWDEAIPPDRRWFLYLPLEHAEDHAMQSLCLRKMATLGNEKALHYAREHAEVIARFGRFPTRNAALGRDSTEDEAEYLSDPDAGW